MLFNHDIEKLNYKTEVYIVWTWVSLGFSLGADYKYIESGWPGSIVISVLLILLAIYLHWQTKKLIEQRQKIEEEEREKEEQELLALKKQEVLQKSKLVNSSGKASFSIGKDVTYATGKEQYNEFVKEIKTRSLEENLKILENKYQVLSSKDKLIAFGEYEKSVKWLENLYADDEEETSEQEQVEQGSI